MNKVLLTGRLTRDPELRVTAAGRSVTQFSVATSSFVDGSEKAEYHNIVVWGHLAEVVGQYLGKGQQVGIEGSLQTRSWDGERPGVRHWKTEVVATSIEMLSGSRKRDYAAEASGVGGGDASHE